MKKQVLIATADEDKVLNFRLLLIFCSHVLSGYMCFLTEQSIISFTSCIATSTSSSVQRQCRGIEMERPIFMSIFMPTFMPTSALTPFQT